MFNRLFFIIACVIFFFCAVHAPWAQDSGGESSLIVEENINSELQEAEAGPQFITVDILAPQDIEPAIVFYIRDDINRKFSGLITNLKLEKIYGVTQENKTATVYFDYSYTSIRNKDSILYEKGKMTFIRFNSGKWFNAELSIYLMDSYPVELGPDKNIKEE